MNLAVAPEGDALLMRKFGSDLTHPAWGKAPGLYRYGLKDDSWERVADEGGMPMEGADGRVYYTQRTWGGPDGGSTALKSVSSSGEDERTHATSSLARSMHLSPDGRFLAFVEGYELYVTRVPALGVSFKVGPKQSAIPQVQLSEYGADYVAWSQMAAEFPGPWVRHISPTT